MNLKGAREEKFGRIAAWLYRKMAEPSLWPMHERIASEVPVARGRILDVGCGPGALTRLIAESRPGASVLGVDASADMLRQAARGSVPENVRFRVGRPATLGLSGEIDFAISVLSFHHWEEPEEELAALHRALRPGGRLWIYEQDANASNADLRADRRPLGGWLRLPAALERRMARGHGFDAGEIESKVRPAIARTAFLTVRAVKSASTFRLELEK